MTRISLVLVLTSWVLLAHAQWLEGPEVIAGDGGGDTLGGVVFEDLDGDGKRQESDPGIDGVLVSNGRDVVVTDEAGVYELPVRPDMDVSVVQPAGWRVPVDDRRVPQFFYTHKPGGTPGDLRFGGLPDTGPAPQQVNFPLRRAGGGDDFECAVIGDSQTYSGDEIGYFRDSAITDLVSVDWSEGDCMIYLGDVVGDDLGLLDRLLEIGAAVGLPQWLVIGNHDHDLDATDNAHSADSWRRRVGPAYYAFEIGQVTFVALNNLVYPCGEADAERPGRDFCLADAPTYNGRIDAVQMQWLENLLDHVPQDRRIVLLHHVPLVSFTDADGAKHQTDNATDVHALLEGRPALSLAGHTHTLENLAPGEWHAGWQEHVGVGALPFRHIIAGAASGSWWQGDFDIDGVPMALQRMGAPRGVVMMAFNGADYVERYRGARIDPERGQWVSLNTPAFREWFDAIAEWMALEDEARDPVPPLSIHDLPDPGVVTSEDLAKGVYLTANVWMGSNETEVEAVFNHGETLELIRTQPGQGEAARRGAKYADPFASMRRLTVARFAIESRQGDERARGYETFQGRTNRGTPQPQGRSAIDYNVHLWKARLPEDLAPGVHAVNVTSTDRHGTTHTDTLLLEVRERRPPRYWRDEIW